MGALSRTNGSATGASTLATSAASTSRKCSGESARSCRVEASDDLMRAAMATPRSALISASSSSSRVSASSFLRLSTEVRLSLSADEVRASPLRSCVNQLRRGAGALSADAFEGLIVLWLFRFGGGLRQVRLVRRAFLPCPRRSLPREASLLHAPQAPPAEAQLAPLISACADAFRRLVSGPSARHPTVPFMRWDMEAPREAAP